MAYDFDGTLDFFAAADNAALSITGALTIAAWIKRTTTTTANNEGVISKYQNQTGATARRAYVIAMGNGGALQFALSTDGNFQSGNVLDSSAGVIGTTNFHHVAARFDPSTRQSIVVDGSEVAAKTSSVAASIADTAAPLWIGQQFADDNADVSFDGIIGEAAVYGAHLSLEECASLAAGFSPLFVRPASLVFYAPLVRPVIDIVGGFALSTNGTPTVADHPPIIYPASPYVILPAAVVGGVTMPLFTHHYMYRTGTM